MAGGAGSLVTASGGGGLMARGWWYPWRGQAPTCGHAHGIASQAVSEPFIADPTDIILSKTPELLVVPVLTTLGSDSGFWFQLTQGQFGDYLIAWEWRGEKDFPSSGDGVCG